MKLRAGLLAAAIVVTGCEPLPDAPDGLDEASSFVFREFYADDGTFEVGIQGFMDWFLAGGGQELTGIVPGFQEEDEPVDSFVVADLAVSDVENYPYNGERVRGDALGVVSVAEMDCTWLTAESFLVRPDQNVVFEEAWETYEREYTSAKEAYEAGHDAGYSDVGENLDPFADGFDPTPYESTFLFTENQANPSSEFGVNLDAYPLFLDFRHGRYTVDGEELGAFAIATHMRDPVVNGAGNGLAQTYSIEINVERPGGKTLRMLTVWAQALTEGITIDDDVARRAAVNKALQSSDDLSALCAAVDQIEDDGTGSGCSLSGRRPSVGWALFVLLPFVRRRR